MLDLYEDGNNVASIAETLRIDQRQIAIRLLRLLFNPEGDIDDEANASRFGKKYLKSETTAMLFVFHQGASIRQIAEEVDRTQLGVAWKLFNLNVPKIPPGLRERISGH